MSYQRWNNIEMTWMLKRPLDQRCFNVRHWRCILTLILTLCNIANSDVGFRLIFNVGSNLFQRWFTTVKRRSSDIEMLTLGVEISRQTYFIKKPFSFDFCEVFLWHFYERLFQNKEFLKAKLNENDSTVNGKFKSIFL